ncbi:hypothetical protein F2Q70_00004065 [Brassica cretica]|uniref:Uncharacterized protein n=1 Tax=Brassica cretica TaxID=69181 RepID=A0A8S9IUB8_BRACR|nr:hypothetical protein F2Q70_00004065 [Brassica cretica]
MTEREAYVKMAVAHAKAMKANNEFAATLEKRLQDVPRSDKLYEIKKVVRELKLGLKMAQDRERTNAAQLATAEKLGNQAASLEPRLRVVSNERKSTLEQVSFLEAKVESSANMFSDDLRRAAYDAKKALADSYLDVLVSLKEKWEKKKAATDCDARLREVMANIDLLKEILNNNLLALDELLRLRTKEVELGSELNVMAVLDFSVGKLDLPQISEDLPEDFFARDSSAVNGADEVTKCSGGQFEDGEFGIEEYRESDMLELRYLRTLEGDWTRVVSCLRWEKKKAATDCEARLREVMANIDLLKEIMNNNLLALDELLRLRTKEVELGSELDVMAVSDFSVGKLDLPQILEDLPEDFFARDSLAANDVDDMTKCSGGQFEDGEFGMEE